MPSFRDAVANYKAAKADPAAPVAVNPPEAVKVLEEQATPEVENTVPKDPPLAPLPETETVRRSRRTKAEMEAARAAQAPASVVQPVTVPSTAPVAVASPATAQDEQQATVGNLLAALKAAVPAGITVTITVTGG